MNRLVFLLMAPLTFLFGTNIWFAQPMATAAAASAGGTISGRVVFVGDVPAAKKVKVTKDAEKCGAEVTNEDLVVGSDKGIQNAVVSVEGLKAGATKPTLRATVDQKGCVFRPHVAIVGVGTPLEILNNDGVLHNFHTHGTKNAPMNKAQPAFRKKMAETFAHAETIKVTCDAHPWMAGWIVVTDHPYIDATDSSGNFTIRDVPSGTHNLAIWHETLGKITKSVMVKPGEDAKITIELGKK